MAIFPFETNVTFKLRIKSSPVCENVSTNITVNMFLWSTLNLVFNFKEKYSPDDLK